MLNPEENRLEYGKELLPPEGFHFVRGVATTYSMDFETLIAALIPLVLRGDLENQELLSNPTAVLQAIRKVLGRLIIFCEAGQIKVPALSNKLIPLLDEIIIPVALRGRGNYFPSFHPKTWMIEYGNSKGESIFRFIVLSRNLTDDQSWDVAVSIDGKKDGGNYSATRHLLPFYSFLQSVIPGNIGKYSDIISKLVSSLKSVSFKCEEPFDSFDIYPMGIEGNAKLFDIFKEGMYFDELVIVSPFLTSSIIGKVNEGQFSGCKRVLISRAESLATLQHTDSNNFRKYILRNVTTEGAYTNDLHAKIYLRQVGYRTELLIGSANATASGIGKNIEMMVRFSCPSQNLNADKFLRDICGGNPDDKASPLCEFIENDDEVLDGDDDEYKKAAELQIKKFCRVDASGLAVKATEGKYRLSIKIRSKTEFDNFVLRPINVLANKVEISGGGDFVFPDLIALEDLSSFFVISVSYPGGKVERVIKIPIEGIPKKRNDAILNGILSNNFEFLKYIMMLLSSNPILEMRQFEHRRSVFTLSKKRDVNPLTGMMYGMYESMLSAIAEHPERIEEVGEVFNMIEVDNKKFGRYKHVYDLFAEIAKSRYRKG